MARLLDQVKGHDIQIRRLLEAAAHRRLGSTLLFVGPSGIGKKKVALGLAQTLLCEHGPSFKEGAIGACGECGACLRVAKGEHESLVYLEASEIQIKIEQVRVLKDFVKLKILGKARVAVVNEAQMMTPQAANSLLKILEEPPPSTYFILVSGQEAGLLPTLRSRCQTLRFAPLTIEQLRELSDANAWILSSSQGRMDRLEDLKQETEVRALALQGFRLLIEGSRFEAISFYQQTVKEKEKALKICQWWQQILRDLWALKYGIKHHVGPLLNPDLEDQLREWAQMSDMALEKMSVAILLLEKDIMANVERALLFENFWKQHALSTPSNSHA